MSRDSRQLQIDVLQSIPATAWTVTPDGQLDFVNRFYLEIMGQTLDDLSVPLEVWNKGGSDLPPFLANLHPDHKERIRKLFWQSVKNGEGWTFEAPFRHASDDRYHWHIDRAVPLRDNHNNVIRFVGTCADIDELKQSESKHKALLEISNLMVGSLIDPGLISAIYGVLREVVQIDSAGLVLFNDEKDCLRIIARTLEKTSDYFMTGSDIDRGDSRIGLVFDNRTPSLVNDLQNEDSYVDDRRLADLGMRSRYLVPLLSLGKCIGVIGIASKNVGCYDRSDTQFISEVANQISLAVENTNAYEQIAELKSRLELENTYLQEEVRKQHNFDEILGNSPELLKLLENVELAAPTEANVLIFGETGSGKELVARAIHGLSPRKNRPLVKINCAAIPSGLVESELFGHVRGAFTGASQPRIGRFELADGGTLFLDEIGEMPIDTQVKLLRVLQEKQFEPVGSNRTVKVDVRVIAATNRDLAKAIKSGEFRSDLYYRLNVIPLHVPALRERSSDIPEMVVHFLEQSSKRVGKPTPAVSRETMKLLVDYAWPGNIRELQNVIERGVVLCKGPILKLGPDLLPIGNRSDQPLHKADLDATLESVEKDHILRVLDKTHWTISGPNGAGAILNVHPNTLRSKMNKLGIERPSRDIS